MGNRRGLSARDRTARTAPATGALAGALVVLLSAWPASMAPAAGREWSDRSGKFKIEAELVRVADGQVYLRGADGKPLRPIKIDRLSQADQEFLDQQKPQTPLDKPDTPADTKAAAPADKGSSQSNLMRWKSAPGDRLRYQTELKLRLGEKTTVTMRHDIELITQAASPDGTIELQLKNRRTTGSFDSPEVKGSFDSKNPKVVPSGPAQDIGSALYIGGWMPSALRMSSRGIFAEPPQTEAIKLTVTNKQALLLYSVLNGQASMRIFAMGFGPLPEGAVAKGGTWTDPWTSPLSLAPPGEPRAQIAADWVYKGRNKDGEELFCQFASPAGDSAGWQLSGSSSYIFDPQAGHLKSSRHELKQTLYKPADEGASAEPIVLPVHMTYGVAFDKAFRAGR